ncbi:MAG: hypothetical protein HY647_03060 [Acidobacteria bacterium]|nr:hypothetical protein [Acidobacteriota bacterium]
MPEFPDSLAPRQPRSKDPESRIRWRTIRYRSVVVGSGTVVALTVLILLLIFPEWRARLVAWLGGGDNGSVALADLSIRRARFTNLDGGVRVRKADQVQWIAADFSTNLDKGDLVQTSRDGVARVAFADGTLYVVKPNTLIVIEENEIQENPESSHVAIQVSSGVVDLSTSSTLAGQSRVLFANAEAQLRENSRALVRNSPETNTHQITVSQGGAQVQRGSERVELGAYEQASFAGADSPLVKERVVAPPVLLTPAEMAPVVLMGSGSAEVEFTWSAVPGADAYQLRVSSSPIFSTVLYNRRVQTTSVRLPSLKEGDYYWTVASIDSRKKETHESEPNQFSVIRQQDGGEILLVVEKYVQHGKVIEIVGRTEPGATVLVNNQPVFNVAANGSFKHFTPPLPHTGPNLITITAQNREGKIATLRKTITIQ